MFKTCLIAFRNVFWAFWKIENLSCFLNFSKFCPYRVHWACFSEKLRTNKFNNCLDTFRNVFGRFRKIISFRFFFDFFQVSTLQGAVGKKNSKKLPRASLDTFGNGFRDFGTLKFFPFLWIFFSLQGALGRAFSVEKISQNILKQCFLGTFLDNFEIFEVFPFLKVFSKPQPYRVQWRFFFRKKITSNRFRTCSDNIRDNFGHLRNIESFHFFPSFLFSSLQCALGKNLTGNMISKHV